MALLRVVNDFLQESDSAHVSILSLLDLSAAFDTIYHDILIKRLHTTFGSSGTVLDWFTSYLSFRTQSVFVDHASTPSPLESRASDQNGISRLYIIVEIYHSGWKPSKCGVPQGSVLGPLLFTLYTQSLSTVICQSGRFFVLTRFDYCNSLLAGLPDNKLDKLQRMQNRTAQIVLRKPRHVSATSLLRTLHWLPVKARIQCKIACLCFQCLSHNTMPPYLSDFLHPYQQSRTLRSLDTSMLSVPRFCLRLLADLSLFLAPLSGIPYLYLSEKLNVFQLSKRS